MVLSIVDIFIPALVLTAMAAFIAGAAWLKRERDAQRSAELQDLARDLDLSFVEKDSYGLVAQLRGLRLFRREGRSLWGRSGKIVNVMRGLVDDTEVYLFDYVYVVSTGKSSREVRQTVFFATDKNWYLPNFHLQPETWWHKVMARLGVHNDINFPENPDFSGNFWLTGEFEELVRKKFDADVQQLITERPPLHLEGSNYYLLAYKPGKALNTDEARVFFEHCARLVRHFRRQKTPELLELAHLDQNLQNLQNTRNTRNSQSG